MISDITGGNLFEVDTVKTYPADYYACIDKAKEELRRKDRPEVKAYKDDHPVPKLRIGQKDDVIHGTASV